MTLSPDFHDWAHSNYACDAAFASHSEAQNYPRWSMPYLSRAIWDHKLPEASRAARNVGLIDAISQVAKGALELILWPAVGGGFLGYGVMAVSEKIKKGEYKKAAHEAVGSPLLALLYSPASVINRIRLIAIDLLGFSAMLSPDFVALQRKGAFSNFPCSGRSLLAFVWTTLKKDELGTRYSWELFRKHAYIIQRLHSRKVDPYA